MILLCQLHAHVRAVVLPPPLLPFLPFCYFSSFIASRVAVSARLRENVC